MFQFSTLDARKIKNLFEAKACIQNQKALSVSIYIDKIYPHARACKKFILTREWKDKRWVTEFRKAHLPAFPQSHKFPGNIFTALPASEQMSSSAIWVCYVKLTWQA
jgi:hypothetical protein